MSDDSFASSGLVRYQPRLFVGRSRSQQAFEPPDIVVTAFTLETEGTSKMASQHGRCRKIREQKNRINQRKKVRDHFKRLEESKAAAAEKPSS